MSCGRWFNFSNRLKGQIIALMGLSNNAGFGNSRFIVPDYSKSTNLYRDIIGNDIVGEDSLSLLSMLEDILDRHSMSSHLAYRIKDPAASHNHRHAYQSTGV